MQHISFFGFLIFTKMVDLVFFGEIRKCYVQMEEVDRLSRNFECELIIFFLSETWHMISYFPLRATPRENLSCNQSYIRLYTTNTSFWSSFLLHSSWIMNSNTSSRSIILVTLWLNNHIKSILVLLFTSRHPDTMFN